MPIWIRLPGWGLPMSSTCALPSSETRSPAGGQQGFAARVHLTEKRSEMLAPHVEQARATGEVRDAAATREGMRRNYGRIAYRPELIEAMRTLFSHPCRGTRPQPGQLHGWQGSHRDNRRNGPACARRAPRRCCRRLCADQQCRRCRGPDRGGGGDDSSGLAPDGPRSGAGAYGGRAGIPRIPPSR